MLSRWAVGNGGGAIATDVGVTGVPIAAVPEDYLTFGELRAAFMAEVEALAAPYDAMLMPTVPCVAPTIAEVDRSDEEYFRWNLYILRNNGLINFLDGCAASVPCHEQGRAPVGLMVAGCAGTDRHTLAVAAAIERALAAN